MNGNRNEIILLSVTKIYISLIVEKKKSMNELILTLW